MLAAASSNRLIFHNSAAHVLASPGAGHRALLIFGPIGAVIGFVAICIVGWLVIGAIAEFIWNEKPVIGSVLLGGGISTIVAGFILGYGIVAEIGGGIAAAAFVLLIFSGM